MTTDVISLQWWVKLQTLQSVLTDNDKLMTLSWKPGHYLPIILLVGPNW